MACNCNNNQPPGPPPPLERQNYPTSNSHHPRDSSHESDAEDVKNENPKEASGGSRKRKAN
ncbi:hypothetical protein JHK87_014994 [Glycine soja]|nr:hypothetical protein JHK87_014994 [Glycine soja]